MDRAKGLTHTPCNLCPLQGIRISLTSPYTLDPADDVQKQTFFHEPCPRPQCDKYDGLRLCDLCRHLRIRHLLLCCPMMYPEWRFELDVLPYREASRQCEFCRFLVTCANYKTGTSPRQALGHAGSPESNQLIVFSYSNGDIRVRSPSLLWLNLYIGKTVPPYIETDWLQGWLSSHWPSEISRPFFATLRRQQKLKNVYVIDVVDECLVRLSEGLEFVALSYVWGPMAGDLTQEEHCTMSNLGALQGLGGLRKFRIPQTVSDAIVVCQRLHQRYLWVDRLCVVQDAPPEELWQQLNQMTAIYHYAAVTLVAASGAGASHGLAGISYARDAGQSHLSIGPGLDLMSSVPNVKPVLEESKWWTRGWTFQEYIASRRLLLITDYGLYLLTGPRKPGDETVASEGPARDKWYYDKSNDYSLVEQFSKRTLTKETDVLRASAGFLNAMYGYRMSFGIPWDEFDCAILWSTRVLDEEYRPSTPSDAFPTWSWTSSTVPVEFSNCEDLVHSLAYWGRIAAGGTVSSKIRPWSPLPPAKTTPEPQFVANNRAARVAAALAWKHGCISSQAPQYLNVDCSADEYNRRLRDRWSIPRLFWDAAFQNHEENGVFEQIDPDLLSHPHLLLVHSQKCSLTLDLGWKTHVTGNMRHRNESLVLIRTKDKRIAGYIRMKKSASLHTLQQSDMPSAEFIALSVDHSTAGFLTEIIRNVDYRAHLSVSKLYGCPCAAPGITNPTHVPECPSHMHFSSPLTDLPGRKDFGEEAAKALNIHLEGLSYFDSEGATLHRAKEPPCLWAMLVAPSGKWAGEKRVYRRLGVCEIYLKRWVKSETEFGSFVLE
ncbi:HET-domain-containing protein [Ophiobolus disseminans]|uniref:HET-domain-containing protein n=1 Tax=Ophiobolus disseminans TaxID=1469910 RepID=A0A6A6ZV44_9PLEO|nr:HET-domain-containing protein [Ophiobolus disseminans]